MHLIKMIASTLIGANLIATAPFALAESVPFFISSASLIPGNGYGQDADEKNGTLLDVRFTNSFQAQNITLTEANDTFTFALGTVELMEPNKHQGIVANETDQLGVSWTFAFTNPLSSNSVISTTAYATAGAVSDAAMDYLLDWKDLIVDFASGGQFSISLNDLSLNQGENGNPKTQYATLKLLSTGQSSPPEPETPVLLAVPEPGSLALAGLGLAALGLASRKRRNYRNLL